MHQRHSPFAVLQTLEWLLAGSTQKGCGGSRKPATTSSISRSCLGLQTVRSYRKTMMKKLGVNNVAGLTQLALAAGLTSWNKPDANPLG